MKREQKLKLMLFDCVVFVQDTLPDATTLLDILRFCDGKKIDYNNINLVKGSLVQEVLSVLELRCSVDGVEFLDDKEMDSVIYGELNDYIYTEYMNLYIEANENLINSMLDDWDRTKTFLNEHKHG